MWGGAVADTAVTWTWRNRSRELNPWLRDGRRRPNMARVVGTKVAVAGLTYALPERIRGVPFRSRVQFGVGAVWGGAATFNVVVRF